MSNKAFGLDIGGTAIKAVALDVSSCRTIAEHHEPSNTRIGPSAVRKAINNTITHFRSLGLSPTTIGIGCAGSVDHTHGVVRNSPNFANWTDVSIRDWIREDHALIAQVENDANSAVYGEWKLGNAKGATNVVLLTLGTGVGGGLILNNQLYRGSTGTGGELGHFSIHATGIVCPCGNIGCFERYCSQSAMRGKSSTLDVKEIFDTPTLASHQELIQSFLHNLRVALTSLANIFDPDIFLLGGGIADGLTPYFAGLQEWLRAHAFPAVGKNVRIEKTALGNLSGAIGAALLGMEHS